MFTMYEGWNEEKEKEGRSSLVGKSMLAGMEDSNTFHEKREACIWKKYDGDEIGQKVLNGDGGSWIREPYDSEALFQLDRYHIYQEVLRRIGNKKAQQEIREFLEKERRRCRNTSGFMRTAWKARIRTTHGVKKRGNY